MKKFFLFIFININLFALSSDAISKVKIAYKIGKGIKAKDGMTFEYALASMMAQESSWGKAVIGDKYDNNGRLKDLYQSSLGNFQIKLETAKLTIKKNKVLRKKYSNLIYDGKSIYSKYALLKRQLFVLESNSIKNNTYGNKDYKKMNYYFRILNNKSWKERARNKESKAISTLAWAKREHLKYKKRYNKILKNIYNVELSNEIELNIKIKLVKAELKDLKNKAYKDTMLINKLLVDYEFGAEIACHYLKMMYNSALKKGYRNPYKRAIGRYNGGWNNISYYNNVKKRMKHIKTLEKNKKIILDS